MMSFGALVEKAPYADILREMIAFAAERLIEVEVGARTGAAHGGGSPDRLAQRTGYRNRDWDAAGTVELPTRKLRRAPIFPSFLGAATDQPGACRYCAPCGVAVVAAFFIVHILNT